MRSTKNIKAVIFDFDETLIDWSGSEMRFSDFNKPRFGAIRDHFAAHGYDLPDVETFADGGSAAIRHEWNIKRETHAGANFGDALLALLTGYGIPQDKIDLDEVYRIFDWAPMPGVAPFPDTHDVLQTLKERGYKIGLITNSFQPMWFRDIELRAYDLLKYLDARITSGDTRFMKPHPAIYWRMLGLLDLMPQDAIMVGDRPGHDIQGAHNVGMAGVLMSPPYLNRPLEGVEPDFTIESLTELLPILDQLD